ncbi:MAG: phosphoadenosine phosphosulfate reductase family protein [Lachnospiraceae bacterium]|nr:phosphoadenosine phosphosulfate reductase family protein [Lachnospiraceae bacterium]
MGFDFLNNVNKRKVLIMLSGGKDSCACLHMLKKHKMDITAIHFVHQWGYQIVTDEAKRICKECEVPLIIYDYSKELLEVLKGFKGGRPCILCKEKMYEITLQVAVEKEIDYICIGDNANDTTTIARIRKWINCKLDETLFLNTFLDSDISLSGGVKVIRPIIDMTSEEVLQYLEKNDIKIQRVGDTGDKYFEYSREGCPIQFHDPGTEITVSDMEKLRDYNTILSTFARENAIRASIHIPSEFIVTIPKGYEEKAKDYLLSAGLPLKKDEKIIRATKFQYIISMKKLYIEIFQDEVTEYLINRFFERLGVELKSKEVWNTDKIKTYVCEGESAYANFFILKDLQVVSFILVSNRGYKRDYIENLIIEVFRTIYFKIYMDEI